MRALGSTMRAELVGAGGVVERNYYLTKRYIWWDLAWFLWTVANTLTIVFIAKGIEATGGTLDVNATMTTPPDRRGRLGLPRDPLRVPDGDGRVGALGGDDRVHVHGAAVARDASRGAGRLRDPLRAAAGDLPVLRLRVPVLRPAMPNAQTSRAFVVLLVASVSFIGIGMMMSVLPLISPEKGTQLGFVAQGTLLVVSGVYYPVERASRVDAVDREVLAGDVRARRDPRGDPGGRGRCRRCGATSGRCS